MPRNKVRLTYLEDTYARKASYKKRKEGLKKKLHELTVLCDVDACAIIYNPMKPTVPEVWPNVEEVKRVADRFYEVPFMERSKKMVTHDSFVKRRITKTNEKLDKLIRENQELIMDKRISDLLSGKISLGSLTIPELNDLAAFAGKRFTEIDRRIESLQKEDPNYKPVQRPPPQSQPPQPQAVVNYGSNIDINHMVAGGVGGYGYVPVGENPGTFHEMQTPRWYAEWVDHMGDHYGSSSRG